MRFFTALLFLSLFSVQQIQSQSISVIYESPDTVNGPTNIDIEAKITFQNSSGSAVSYLAEKIEVDLLPEHQAYYCWGPACYSSFTFLATDTVVLSAGALDSTFKAYLIPYATGTGVSGISTVKYRIFNLNDTADKFEKVFVFVAGDASALSHASIAGADVYVYPNPASNYLKAVYEGLEDHYAELVIRNVLGTEVIRREMPPFQNMVNMNIAELKSGIYLYSIVVDGQPVITKKLTVRK